MIIHATPSCNSSKNQGQVIGKHPPGSLEWHSQEMFFITESFFKYLNLLALGKIS